MAGRYDRKPPDSLRTSLRNYYYVILLGFLILGLANGSDRWVIGPFVRPAGNPVLKPDSTLVFVSPVTRDTIRWQAADVFNPAAIVRNGEIYLLYRCEDNPGAGIGRRTSTIGVAVSEDGIHFTKYKEPVLYPDSGVFFHYDYPGGCEDPRVVQTEDGLYMMTYTSWNLKVARLSVATSRDLYQWKKRGPAFARAYGGRFLDTWSKSGAIVTMFNGDVQVATKIDGKYWMYWGDHFIHIAYSNNLVHWTPMLDSAGRLMNVVSPRPKMYDSQIAECGPPAVITKDGIVLLYNGENAWGENASPSLAKGRYSVGELLFDRARPWKVIARTCGPILKPTLVDELTGQYKAGTTFVEGLVRFKGRWYLYYGAADSRVNVAIAE
ncbi:MAG TPA: glycoside hydrolase family 130 protein [Candidatus Kryptonia bacterium]